MTMSLLLTQDEMRALALATPDGAPFILLSKAITAYYASEARCEELESDLKNLQEIADAFAADIKRLSDALAEAQENSRENYYRGNHG